MKNAETLYNVWTDGSYRAESAAGGAAWHIVHRDDAFSDTRSIPKLDKAAKPHGSDIAELCAVGGAMRSIPHGSSVHLRLDAQNIIDWLKAGRIESKTKAQIKALRDAFDYAVSGMALMSSVEITKVSGKQNEQLQLVNQLARKASGLAARA